MEDDLDLVRGNSESALRGVDLGEEGREGIVVGAIGGSNWEADIKLENVSIFVELPNKQTYAAFFDLDFCILLWYPLGEDLDCNSCSRLVPLGSDLLLGCWLLCNWSDSNSWSLLCYWSLLLLLWRNICCNFLWLIWDLLDGSLIALCIITTSLLIVTLDLGHPDRQSLLLVIALVAPGEAQSGVAKSAQSMESDCTSKVRGCYQIPLASIHAGKEGIVGVDEGEIVLAGSLVGGRALDEPERRLRGPESSCEMLNCGRVVGDLHGLLASACFCSHGGVRYALLCC